MTALPPRPWSCHRSAGVPAAASASAAEVRRAAPTPSRHWWRAAVACIVVRVPVPPARRGDRRINGQRVASPTRCRAASPCGGRWPPRWRCPSGATGWAPTRAWLSPSRRLRHRARSESSAAGGPAAPTGRTWLRDFAAEQNSTVPAYWRRFAIHWELAAQRGLAMSVPAAGPRIWTSSSGSVSPTVSARPWPGVGHRRHPGRSSGVGVVLGQAIGAHPVRFLLGGGLGAFSGGVSRSSPPAWPGPERIIERLPA